MRTSEENGNETKLGRRIFLDYRLSQALDPEEVDPLVNHWSSRPEICRVEGSPYRSCIGDIYVARSWRTVVCWEVLLEFRLASKMSSLGTGVSGPSLSIWVVTDFINQSVFFRSTTCQHPSSPPMGEFFRLSTRWKQSRTGGKQWVLG